LVKGEEVASVMSPSMRSVRKLLAPLRASGRCQRWCRLCLCESHLISLAAGPKTFS
jgi:hypothetical protein